ncbi:sodium/potassium/calcium exchanger 3-like [Periplaneta americana]|uniref:sodium/potassium/calcium exchanger 3-like n=1 Tax=Periplaneta americana TaxID=6978 RepID=UPI0037E8F3AF
MVKSNARPEFRPRKHLGYRLLFLVGVPTLYSLLAVGGRQIRRLNVHEQHTGRQLLWHVEEVSEQNCTPPALSEFPQDSFTPEQRQAGAVAIHALVCCYLFLMLAMICDDYFVPSIQKLCENLNMSEDVAGATFMAAAVSSPELFINIVGTFITEGDIGVGTVVGSAVFNVLAVPACCGLFAREVVTLNWWSLTRDCVIYSFTVVALIATLWDGRIEWYEALILVLFYSFYILAMYYNVQIGQWVKTRCHMQQRQGYKQIPGSVISKETNPLIAQHMNGSMLSKFQADEHVMENGYMKLNGEIQRVENIENSVEENETEDDVQLFTWPSDSGCGTKLWWLIVRPIAFLLAVTIPNCRSRCGKRLYFLTFIMCIVWIGVASYVVAWMITVIGDTLNIPDSVMGLTFMAAGMSVPEAVSSVIVTNQGHGSMGISNSIGSNTFDILLCLGLPWLIKSAFLPAENGHYVRINSGGMGYSAISLFSTLFLLYLTFLLSGFKLNRKVGAICLFIYAVFLIVAALIELNIFFPVNLPVCGRG